MQTPHQIHTINGSDRVLPRYEVLHIPFLTGAEGIVCVGGWVYDRVARGDLGAVGRK
jgi:hypothetical protein